MAKVPDCITTTVNCRSPVELLAATNKSQSFWHQRPHRETEPPRPVATMQTRVAASTASLSGPSPNRFFVPSSGLRLPWDAPGLGGTGLGCTIAE
jgi:hypothetical protein